MELKELQEKHEAKRQEIIAKYGDCIPFTDRPEMKELNELAQQMVTIMFIGRSTEISEENIRQWAE